MPRGTNKQRERQDFDRYRALIATPGDLAPGVGITLPANGDLYVSLTSGQLATAVVLSVGDRDIGAPALTAGQRYNVGRFERGATIEQAGSVDSGELSLYVRDGLGTLFKIAEG